MQKMEETYRKRSWHFQYSQSNSYRYQSKHSESYESSPKRQKYNQTVSTIPYLPDRHQLPIDVYSRNIRISLNKQH